MTDSSIGLQSTPALVPPRSLLKQSQDAKEDDYRKSEEDTTHDLEKGSSSTVPPPTDTERFFVEFEGPNDPDNPKSWTPKRRWGITISMGLMVFTVTFASSIFSVNIGVVQEKFNVELVTATLGVALFVLVRSASSR
jgi:hypothetical protein